MGGPAAMVCHDSVPSRPEGEAAESEIRPPKCERPSQPDGIVLEPTSGQSQSEGASAPLRQGDALQLQQSSASEPSIGGAGPDVDAAPALDVAPAGSVVRSTQDLPAAFVKRPRTEPSQDAFS